MEQARQFHVGWAGDLDVAVAAGDYADFDLFQPFHQAGLVCSDEAVFAGFPNASSKEVVAENLRCLRKNEAFARQGLADLIQMDEFYGVHRNDADDGGAGLASLPGLLVRLSARSMNGRTASWTATRSVSGARRRERVFDRLLRDSPPSTRRIGLIAARPATRSPPTPYLPAGSR